jgi:hypothetical protein
MSKSVDTGHGRNVVNGEKLITYVTGYGAVYNPSNASIQLSSLTEKAAAARAVNEQVNDLIAKNANAVAARDEAFVPLKPLSTRMLNGVKASNVPQQVLDNAITNNRRLHGDRASPKLTEEEKKALIAKGVTVNEVTSAQLGYDNLLDSFDKQIKVLATIPQYAPNEVDLQLPTLTALYNDLLAKNREVINNNAQLSTLRLNRDKILYDAETGIVALALDVKSYVKSVFGSTSPEFKQISGVKFRTLRN